MTTLRTRVKDALRTVLPERTFERLDKGVDLARYEAWRRSWARSHGLPTRPRGTLLFHPHLPTEWHVAWKMSAACGYRITDDPAADVDAVIRWNDTTWWEPDAALLELAERLPVVNLRSSDISKSRVNAVFAEVFGYDLGVDPTRYEGPMVAKSEANATHDGVIVTGPLAAAEPDVSYQLLVDNHVDGRPDLVEVWRTPLLGGEVPLVYRKVRPVHERLTDAAQDITIHAPDEVYSPEELDRLRRFAEAFDLDLGEADVLRHTDGRIYLVDANNTPWGPPRQLDAAGKQRAVEVLAPAFQRLLDRLA